VHATVWATDASADALAVTRANIAGCGRPGGRVRIAEGDWFAALPTTCEARSTSWSRTRRTSPRGTTSRPRSQGGSHATPWWPGPSGLEHLERIVAGSPAWLRPGGSLVVELAPWQAAPVAELARRAGFASAEVGVDLAGRERMVVAVLAER
jgi:release factor glutamine methyltransferase